MSAWRTQTNSRNAKIILIVSQDSKATVAWERAFKQRGYYVVHEQTPRHALQAARLIAPALVIFALDIPQAERLSLYKELRSMTSCALLELLAETGKDVKARYHLAGVDERLSPAISPAALLGKSLAWLA